ncbi:hypothetical protein GBAR_LOCUS29570 [Geodia barretti]|uniref:Uncharacterized protein n=1 Tax=Geodia barretti TaxID=519541 RepID=A0AA35TTD4_GEOBA|nr:hypothetical protein GBAR_LOCUS29570 [Geodia barretti]
MAGSLEDSIPEYDYVQSEQPHTQTNPSYRGNSSTIFTTYL